MTTPSMTTPATPIQLHQFAARPGHLNDSSFCLKLECWLKQSALAWRESPIEDMSGAPKGQVPWVTLPDGTAMGDSTLIIEHLERVAGRSLDGWLSRAQRATVRAIAALCEERLYYAILRFFIVEEEGFRITRDVMLSGLPAAAAAEMAEGWRRHSIEKLHCHGFGRHTPTEVSTWAAADIQALSDLLDDQPWLFGDRPTTADCSAWAIIATLMSPIRDTPLRAAVLRHDNLVRYYRWGLTHWFPDLARAQAEAA